MAPPAALVVSARHSGHRGAIRLVGEFDMSGTESFRAVVGDVVARRPEVIEVDAAQLEFIDAAGLRELVVARELADANGIAFRIGRRSRPLVRILDMTGLDEVFEG